MSDLLAKNAIVLYESKDRTASDIVSFRVSETGVLTSPGRISRGLIALLKRITVKKIDECKLECILPAGALAAGNEFVILEMPSQQRRVTLIGEQKTLLFPNMVFACGFLQGQYSMRWMYHQEEGPIDPNLEVLAPAQFLNTDVSGWVCLGSVGAQLKRPRTLKELADRLIEEHFMAQFTEWRSEQNKELVALMESATRSRARNKLHRVWKHIKTNTHIDKWTSLNQLYESFL